MRSLKILFLLAFLFTVVGCGDSGQSVFTSSSNVTEPELVALSIEADPAALARSAGITPQILTTVVQLRVSVYDSSASLVTSKVVPRNGTATFLLPRGNYLIRMEGLDNALNVLGYFDRLIELLNSLLNRFPGLIWNPNPPVVRIPDPVVDPPFLLFSSAPAAVTGGDLFSVTAQAYDAKGNPVTLPITGVTLAATGVALNSTPTPQNTQVDGKVTFTNLSFPDSASGTAKLTVSANGVVQAESNPITVTAAPAPPTPSPTPPAPTPTAIERISVDDSGNEAHGYSFDPTMSTDGRFVAFSSDAPDLVTGDTNATRDIFVYDRTNRTTERVSVDTAGNQSNAFSYDPTISADGRYVVFVSSATNLVAGDTNGVEDIFLHDRTTGVTERVSLDSMGNQPNGNSSRPSISADGLRVVFESSADNLIAGPSLTLYHVYLYDRSSHTVKRLSHDPMGGEANGNSEFPWISASGRFVSFRSDAGNLVSGDTNGVADVFVYDLNTDSIERVSVDSMGNEANGGSIYDGIPVLSDDGSFVVFQSSATNLVAGDTNGVADIFVHDRTAHTTERVSVDAAGVQADQECLQPWISGDGRFVTFDSMAGNLISGDTNSTSDIFVYDRTADDIARVSVDGDGNEVPGWSTNSAISGDGKVIAFGSIDALLVPNDTNNDVDLFATNNPFVP